MNIVFMGSPHFALPALEELMHSPHNIVGVFSQPPRKSGRGMLETKTPVHQLAEKNNIPVFTPLKLGAQAQEILKNLKPDFLVVAAYGLLLPQAVLDIAPSLNIHPSALPRWRGAAPLNWTILAGDTTTDICIMEMVKALDAGPVYARQSLTLSTEETAGTLHDKAATIGAKLLLKVLNNWQDYKNNAVPQHEDGVTYAHKITKEDRRTNFDQPVQKVLAHIHGLAPFPSATANLGNTPFKLLKAEQAETTTLKPAGHIISSSKEEGLIVACKGGAIRLKTLQPQGKKPMDDLAFLRGHDVTNKIFT